MPAHFEFPLNKWIHKILPEKKKTDGYLIKDVHVIVGDGSELFHQNVLVKDGVIRKISSEVIGDADAAVIDGGGSPWSSRRFPGPGQAITGMTEKADSWYRRVKKERVQKKAAIS